MLRMSSHSLLLLQPPDQTSPRSQTHYVPFARYYVPALMIRLGKDQECYDLVKWFRSLINVKGENWATETRLGVTVKNADAFEPDKISIGGRSELDLKIHKVLIKVRILLDIEALHNLAEAVGTRLPGDMVAKIKPYVLRTSMVAKNRELLEAGDHKASETSMLGIVEIQLCFLMLMVHSENPYFWPTLFSPQALKYRNHPLVVNMFEDKSWTSNSPGLAVALVRMTIGAWVSTPGALDFVRKQWDTIMRSNKEHNIPMPRDPCSNPMPGTGNRPPL